MFGEIRLSVDFFQLLLKHCPIFWFQFDQLLYKSFVFIHLIVLSAWVHPPWNRSVSVLSHIGPYYSPRFHKGHISLVLHLWYFLLFFINILRSRKKWGSLVDSLDILFHLSNLPLCDPGLFCHPLHMSDVLCNLPCRDHIFDIWSTSGMMKYFVQSSRSNTRFLLPFGNLRPIKSQNVCVSRDFLPRPFWF